MKHILYSILLAFSSVQLMAQESNFSLSINPDTIAIGQAVKIKFKIENLKGDLEISDWDERLIYHGQPSITNHTSIINDVMTQSKEYIFSVQTNHVGEYAISGKFKIEETGKILECHGKIVALKDYNPHQTDNIDDDMQFKRRDQFEFPKNENKKKRKIYKL